jgi:hypothetical protein
MDENVTFIYVHSNTSIYKNSRVPSFAVPQISGVKLMQLAEISTAIFSRAALEMMHGMRI